MGTVATLFFDSYARHEIAVGSERYHSFLKGVRMVTTKMNLMELHYSMLRMYGQETADESYDFFVPYVVEITDEIIKKANLFRMAHKQRKMSYIDCMGYIIARTMGIRFLTGDKQFKDMDNVEFVP